MLVLAMAAVCFPQYVAAQGNDSLKQAKIEELKKYRRDLYIQKLALTPKEAEGFFPIYDEYEQKLREVKKEFKKKWKDKTPESMTEAEATAYLQDATKLREKELELFKTYSERLKAVIPAKKIILIPHVSKEVHRELLMKAREMKGGQGGYRRGPGGPGHGPGGPGGPKGGPHGPGPGGPGKPGSLGTGGGSGGQGG